MLRIRDLHKYSFWTLVLAGLVFTGLGLSLVRWQYRHGWVQDLWHICQSGLQNLDQHRSVVWQLAVFGIVLVVVGRGSWNIWQQWRSTQRFVQLFLPLQAPPPARLRALAAAHNLSLEKIIYLNLTATHAFCLGLWRPRIWLTAGLVSLLTDEELAAVLRHEMYHCRQRDPLRLLISRGFKSAFFFLPLMSDLATQVELQQEVAADQSVIDYLGDDLPLLCTLQKLLTQKTRNPPLTGIVITPFNITEARLRRLIYPTQAMPSNWRRTSANWFINAGVVLFLAGIAFLSTQPVIEHQEVGACIIEEVSSPLQTQLTSFP